MTVSLFQWRAVRDIFNCRSSAMSYLPCNLIKNFVPCSEILIFCWSSFITLLTLIYIYSFLQCHGDIELNAGPRKLKINSFSSVIEISIAVPHISF